MKIPNCKDLKFCMLGDLAEHLGCRTEDCPPTYSRPASGKRWDSLMSSLIIEKKE